jgi:hypothetical protein
MLYAGRRRVPIATLQQILDHLEFLTLLSLCIMHGAKVD